MAKPKTSDEGHNKIFTVVDPASIPLNRIGRKGRFAYPIMKMFMESGAFCVKLNKKELGKNTVGLSAQLSGYVKRHQMPIKVFVSDGEVYLMRLDIDVDGKAVPDWKTQTYGEEPPIEDAPTRESVSKRAPPDAAR